MAGGCFRTARRAGPEVLLPFGARAPDIGGRRNQDAGNGH